MFTIGAAAAAETDAGARDDAPDGADGAADEGRCLRGRGAVRRLVRTRGSASGAAERARPSVVIVPSSKASAELRRVSTSGGAGRWKALAPPTRVAGLYLTGQDSHFVGVVSALRSGVFTATRVSYLAALRCVLAIVLS